MNSAPPKIESPAPAITIGQKLKRFLRSISTKLQFLAILLSLVGIGFGVKSYLHVREVFGAEASGQFLEDLWVQIIIAAIINIFVAAGIFRIVTRPVNTLNESMRRLAQGDLELKIPYAKRGDEIGSTARKVLTFQQNAVELKQFEAQSAAEEERIKEEQQRLMQRVADEFNMTVKEIVDRLNNSAHVMQQTSQNMAGSMDKSKQNIEDLKAESSHTSENVNSVASAAEELSMSIKEIEQQTERATNIAEGAVDAAKNAGDTVLGLSGGAEKIGAVIDLINDIAEQINLLALNATIEAARAGEAGKGFAVVASEVKNLANQTAKATGEISSHIRGIQDETKSAVEFIESISKTIEEINDISSAISESIEQQGQATQEIANNIQQAALHTNKLSDNVIVVSESSVKTGDSAHDMLGKCSDLAKESEVLSGEIDKFLQNIRAA